MRQAIFLKGFRKKPKLTRSISPSSLSRKIDDVQKFVRVRLLLTHNSHVGKNYVVTFFAQKIFVPTLNKVKKRG